MVRALRHGTPVAVDGREGRKSLALLTGIYTSAREKRPVRIEGLR
jgi:predicted dehydrogenase